MNETTKAGARRARMPLFQRAFQGKGIDIGGGGDPLVRSVDFPDITECENFDMVHGNGDANQIDHLRPRDAYDFVYSSQTLEDMDSPVMALFKWGKLVKPGGHLVFTVPDFELYEAGVWPSQRNGAHRTCWGIGPNRAAPRSAYMNVLQLLDGFCQPNESRTEWRVLLVHLADTNFDYTKIGTCDQTLGDAEAFIECALWRRA